MTDGVLREVPVWRVGSEGTHHSVIREGTVQLVLNARPLIRMSCLPDALEDLARGFLVSEGIIESPLAIRELLVSPDRTTVEIRADVDAFRLVTFRERVAVSSGCGGGAASAAQDLSRCRSPAWFRPADISGRMKELQHASVLFRQTGGVHAAAVTDCVTLSAFAEDIGRHNAVDKCLGRCLAEGTQLETRALLVTGRLSADVLSKAIRVGLPVVVSRGAVTSQAIELARSADVAAVGFARGPMMNVYTAPWRLGLCAPEETAQAAPEGATK